MSGSGHSSNVQLYSGQNGNPIASSEAGNLYVQSNFNKVKNVGRIILRTSKPTQLPDVPAAWVMISNAEGNGNVWLGGYGTDAPAVGVGIPIQEGHSPTFTCNNINQYSLIAERDGDPVYIACGGSGKDVNIIPGNPAPLDLTPPTVVSSSPANGATNVAANSLIVITMSEAILANSVSNLTVTVSPSIAYTASVDSSDPTKINLTHVTNLAFSTVYTVTVNTGVTDLSGNNLASNFVFSFTSSSGPPPPDTTPPTVVAFNPANGEAVNASITPSITFSEAMKLSSFSSSNTGVTLWINGQEISGSSFSLSPDLKTVFLNNVPLTASNLYNLVTLPYGGGPSDLAGNVLTAKQSILFSTSSASPATTIYNVGGDSYKTLFAGSTHEVKETVADSYSSLYGYAPVKFTFTFQAQGAPPGNITISITHRQGNNTPSTAVRTIGTIAASSIGPTDTVIVVSDSANTAQLKSNDQITVTYNNGDSSNNILVKVSSYDAIDGTDSYMSTTNSSNNNVDFQSADLAMKVDGF